jgi:hypothetical protein
VDGSDLFYTCACWKIDRIPPTAVGGLFRSLLLTHEERAIVVELSAILLIRLDRKDLNKSTNCRWWDLQHLKDGILCRKDLNHPPTTVGGISTFLCKAEGCLKVAGRSEPQIIGERDV